jgi:glutamate-1-semialdehyde aminotransferase
MITRHPSASASAAIDLASVLFALAACSSVPPPTAELAVASTNIANAEQAGALQSAPVELTAARAKLNAANEAARQGDNTTATRLAEEAEADAKLAEVKAHAANVNEAVTALPQSATNGPSQGGGPVSP